MIKRFMWSRINNIPFCAKLDCVLYKFLQRKRKQKAFHRLASVRPLKVVIGASGLFNEGWIGSEKEILDLLNRKHWHNYFKKNSIDVILAEHVWEHLSIDEGLKAAKQCYLYIKLGGYLRVAVPDGFCPNSEYIECVKPGGTGDGSAGHKVLFTHLTFSDLFLRAGFQVNLLEYYDSKGVFHYTDWEPKDGAIRRSRRFDARNKNGILGYTSIILDAHKK
jgi:predicted SAM-dependent methyltransferase